MLDKVKLALRITTTDFDEELITLIDAAKKDLKIAGVDNTAEEDSLVIRAIITFVKMNFGEPANYDRLKDSYKEQKAQMGMNSAYTTFKE